MSLRKFCYTSPSKPRFSGKTRTRGIGSHIMVNAISGMSMNLKITWIPFVFQVQLIPSIARMPFLSTANSSNHLSRSQFLYPPPPTSPHPKSNSSSHRDSSSSSPNSSQSLLPQTQKSLPSPYSCVSTHGSSVVEPHRRHESTLRSSRSFLFLSSQLSSPR